MMKRWICGVWGSSAMSSLLENPRLKQKLTMRPTTGFQRYESPATARNVFSIKDSIKVGTVQDSFTSTLLHRPVLITF